MLFTVFSILAMVGLDQLTKYWATLALAPDKVVPFLPGIMEFRYILNDGAAFSMFSGRSWGQWFLVGVTTAALLVVLYLLLLRRNKLQPLAYAGLLLIEAGGIGNLIDRIVNGYVVDFFATTFVNFAVFNVADCFVTIGVALLVVYYLRSEIAQKKQKETAAAKPAAGLEPVKNAMEEQGEHHVQ